MAISNSSSLIIIIAVSYHVSINLPVGFFLFYLNVTAAELIMFIWSLSWFLLMEQFEETSEKKKT